ncbi:MAG: methyl-accepting chemotaxis protein [Phycisphaeraceae bacterium]|nr:methyl-accepting chemotaxis protein [Phycisphaeraceae bacterium]
MRYRTQVLVLVASVAVTCAAVVAWLSYRTSRELLESTLKAQVRGLAIGAASMVNAETHERATARATSDSDDYRVIERELRRLRDQWRSAGVPVRFVYTMVPDPRTPSGAAFMVDAEEDGPDKSLPGDAVEGSLDSRMFQTALAAGATYSRDQWGTALTGTAPILGPDGRMVAVAGVDIPLESIRELDRSLAISGGVALLGAAVVALLAGWILAGRVTRPLELLRARAGAMADGDLAESALTYGGARETEAVAVSLDSLRQALRSIVARIQEASVCANASCTTLHDRTTHEADRAREAASNAVEAAGRAGEIATTARTLADAASDLRSMAGTVIATGTEGIENLRNIAAGVMQIRESSTSLAAQLESLRDRARAVDGLLEAMVSVADRSNLLSLNAEIEAAKAGESGRGFMVVAGEIRRLAEQAAASALQIEANVQRMHAAVDEGVRSVNELVEVLGRGADRTQHGSELLQSTIRGIEELAPRIAAIADASVRQREAAEAISRLLGTTAENATNALDFFESVDGLLVDFQRRGSEMAAAASRFRC